MTIDKRSRSRWQAIPKFKYLTSAGAQDKKRAKIFTRLIKELAVAARGGTDPASNPRLRGALLAARAANMPKDNIERVLKKAEGGEGEQYEEIRYEGWWWAVLAYC